MVAKAYIVAGHGMAGLQVEMMDAGMTRRTLLGSVGAATMFPQLAAGVSRIAPPAALPAMQIAMRVDEPRHGLQGRRHAVVLAGRVEGSLVQGTVQSGRLEWLADPLTGAVDIAIDLQLLRADGRLLQLRDRSVPADGAAVGAPGVATAPQLFDSAGSAWLAPAQLAGRLDASGLARGVIWLRAFDRA